MSTIRWRRGSAPRSSSCLLPAATGSAADEERILSAIDERTALVAISHVLFKSAFVLDVAPIAEKCRRAGALLVLDAYQSVGTLPVSVESLGADMLVGGVLKWLCGGPGGAFLYVRPDLARTLEPALTGWMAHPAPFDFEPPPMRYRDDAFRFLIGTPDIPALYAAREGPAIVAEAGIEAIREKSLRQTSRLIALAEERGWRCSTPRDPARRGGTAAVDFENALEVSREFNYRGVVVDYRPESASGSPPTSTPRTASSTSPSRRWTRSARPAPGAAGRGGARWSHDGDAPSGVQAAPAAARAVSASRLPRAVGSSAVFGCAIAFVAAVNLVRSVRPALLVDPDPSWVIPRLLLALAVVVAAVAAGGISAACFFRWSRSTVSLSPLPRLPFSSVALGMLAVTAFLLGTFARLVKLDSIPAALWIDDVSEIAPALDLSGGWRDFANSVRAVPFGESPSGTVGVLYLEFFRLILLLFGTNTFSLRLPAAIAGVASLVTTGLLARRVLPRGGATLAILILAGLYWHVTMSRLGWNALVVAPIVGLATLLLLHARDRPRPILALCAGAVMGIGAHVYMAAWVAAGGLLAIACWPSRAPAFTPRLIRVVLVRRSSPSGSAWRSCRSSSFRRGGRPPIS